MMKKKSTTRLAATGIKVPLTKGSEAYNGKCPLCSGQLELRGNKLFCLGDMHYACYQEDFEKVWHDHDGSQPEILLAQLKEINQVMARRATINDQLKANAGPDQGNDLAG